MGWKLKVLEYGKIKSAEIEVSPLTLFVGDNNSGKSYLMALLWGIQNLGVSELISSVLREETKLEHELIGWIRAQVALACEQGEHIAQVCEIEKELQAFLREGLRQNKDNLVKKIFNSSDVKIKDLQIELKDLDKISLTFTKLKDRWGSEELDSLRIKNNTGTEYTIKLSEIEWGYQNNLIICMILSLAMEISIGEVNGIHENIYLPAARTGFMLTKDIINKAGRNAAFNIGVQQEEMIPFIRPINQFLDVMNDLSFDSKGDRGAAAIAEYLENYMAEGTVEMSTLPNKEVLYVPAGQEKGIPLRIVSAVVTEISPLIFQTIKMKSMYKRVDHMIFERQCEDKWKLHLIEMKGSVGERKWDEIKGKFRASYLVAQAIAGMLEVKITETVMYTTFEKVQFAPSDTMPSARRVRSGETLVRMKDEWAGARFGLNFGERTPFIHKAIQMTRNEEGILAGDLMEG